MIGSEKEIGQSAEQGAELENKLHGELEIELRTELEIGQAGEHGAEQDVEHDFGP